MYIALSDDAEANRDGDCGAAVDLRVEDRQWNVSRLAGFP